MNSTERATLYEKLYFGELERRDKISARLALPFAVIVATVGLLSYFLQLPEKPDVLPWNAMFWSLYGASVAALLAGVWFFRKAWFGHTDRLLPTAGHIEEYYRLLEETYRSYEDSQSLVDKHFRDFLFKYFVECSSANAINNDRRSFDIYRATASLTASVLLAFSLIVPVLATSISVQEDTNVQTGTASTTTAPSASSD
jgi:hypothetical protein